jgi:hypothetical protein
MVTTTLSGSIPDKSSLHSILLKIRDVSLTQISVTRSEFNLEVGYKPIIFY